MWWATGLWVRRTSAAIALPGMIGLVLAATWSRSGWEYEWDWAFSWTARTTVLLGPVLGGLVAHDRARRHTPTLTTAERAATRGVFAAMAVPLAVFLLGMAAWLAAASVVAVWVARNNPIGIPTLNVFAEVALVLLAASFLGAAVGSWLTNRAAGPVAALVVYALALWGPDLTLRSLMAAGSGTGTMVGIERNPAWFAGFLAVHAAIALAAALAVAARRTVSGRLRFITLMAAGIVIIAGATGFRASGSDGPYVLVATENTCVGAAPQVCGPVALGEPLEIAQHGLKAAYNTLAASGLQLRGRYDLGRGLYGKVFPSTSGVLTLDSGTFSDGAYSRDDLLMTLSTPTQCAEYYAELPPDDLLAAQSTVMRWIDQRLDGSTRDPAPAEVAAAYQLLRECAPFREPMQ